MYYTVKTDSGTFQILDETKGNIQYFRIIDRSGKDCMQIRHIMNENPPELVLSGVSYKPNCTIHMDMESGKPTRDMIRALLVFVLKTVESIPEISFLDQSSFDCIAMDNKHKIEVNLCLHNFILYGETWYQRYFGAIPFYEDDVPKILESNALLEKPYSNIQFEEFIKDISRYATNDEWISTIHDELSKPFAENQNKSWRSFFKTIFNRSSDIACNLFEEMRSWIVIKFIKFPYNDLHMKIMRETIESYDEYTKLNYSENVNPVHKKKVINTSNAILYMNGINYGEESNNFNDFLNIGNYSGGKLKTRKRKSYAIKKYKTYHMYMSESKGRPSKLTKKRYLPKST